MRKLILGLLFSIIIPITNAQSVQPDPKEVGRLYDFISDWWKTPYKYGGGTARGIDCSAFTGKLYKYVYNTSIPRTAKEQFNYSKRVSKNNLKDGDLVFFRTHIKSGWHVGVYIVDGFFVHASSHRGVYVSNLKETYYAKKYYGGGRIRPT
jgi:lipoprotein Spr